MTKLLMGAMPIIVTMNRRGQITLAKATFHHGKMIGVELGYSFITFQQVIYLAKKCVVHLQESYGR